MNFQMIHIKTEKEVELIRESSLLVGKALAELARLVRPGVTTIMLDRVAEEFIRDHDAIPGFKGYEGFPATLCTSLNEQVVHGIPNGRELKDGDIISIDCGVIKNGFYGDSAYTFLVGEVQEETRQLLIRTRESLYRGIDMAQAGKRIGDIGNAIQQHVESFGYSVVRDLVGHGIGRHLHEKPEIPNYGKRGEGIKLKEGMTICIEPMINLGTRMVFQEKDGWTIRTVDMKPSAHFEHTVVVRKDKCEILSTFQYIEEIIQNT
jgi:methionyl aminopeptidase